MTTLDNRPNTALLIVDVQNGVVEGAPERDAVVGNVGSLVEKAREQQVPVVWVQHSDEGLPKGSDEWKIVPELSPDEAEPLIEKNYGDSFEGTTWKTFCLTCASGGSSLPARRPMRASARRSTAHSPGGTTPLWSATRTRPRTRRAWGAPPPEQVIAHTNLYWKHQAAPGKRPGRSRPRTSTSADEVRRRHQRGASARERRGRAFSRAQAACTDASPFADIVRSARGCAKRRAHGRGCA